MHPSSLWKPDTTTVLMILHVQLPILRNWFIVLIQSQVMGRANKLQHFITDNRCPSMNDLIDSSQCDAASSMIEGTE